MKQVTALVLMFLAALPGVAAPVGHHEKTEAPAPFLDEARRKGIYYELAVADNRAVRKADAAYPTDLNIKSLQPKEALRNAVPNMEMNDRLIDKYHAVIQRRYHLSHHQVMTIIIEGVNKHWPAPIPAD